MAAVPSAINLITNHLSELDKEKAVDNNSTNSSETILAKDSYNDKDQLVEEGDEKKCFVQIYNKFWPFRVLKITNLLFLLIIFIGSTLTASTSLYWSNYWTTLFYERPYNLSKIALGQFILLSLAICSIIVHRFTKSNFMTAMFSLMDICFFAISIPTLILANIIFSLKSVAEYRWFGAKLANFNYTYEASIDLTESRPEYYSLDAYDTRDWFLEQVERRKKEILINLLFDPVNSILSGIGILVNILLIVLLYKKMRKANIWANGVNSYKTLFPNCSKIEQKYSCHYPFGFLKNIQWLFPTIIIFSSIYIPYVDQQNISIEYFLPIVIICFIQWLLYYCSVHLSNSDGKEDRPIRLSVLFFLDIFIAFTINIGFIFCYLERRYRQTRFEDSLVGLSIILYGGYSLFLLFTFCRNNDELFKFPISINVKIEFNQKNVKDELKDKKVNEEKLKDEKENNENKEEN